MEEKDRLLRCWPAVCLERRLHCAKLATALESCPALCLVRGTRVDALATYIEEETVVETRLLLKSVMRFVDRGESEQTLFL